MELLILLGLVLLVGVGYAWHRMRPRSHAETCARRWGGDCDC